MKGKQIKITIAAILMVACFGFSYAAIASDPVGFKAVNVADVSKDAYEEVIRAYESQVSIIKWIGGLIVTSLSASIAILYRSLETANNQARKDLVSGIEKREELIRAVLDSNADVIRSNDDIRKRVEDLSRDVKETQDP